MKTKLYSQIATEAGQERIANIRQTMQMIENELQAYESQFGLDCEDAAALKNLDIKLEETFQELVEASFG